MTTTRTEYMRGYADGAAGRPADPPPEVALFAPLPREGAPVQVTRSSMWYEAGTRAKLVQTNGSVWEADFEGQGNRNGSYMKKTDGTARWWIADCDFKVIG